MSTMFPTRAKKKPAKYLNDKVKSLSGEQFDSKRERARYRQLGLMQTAGVISGLRRQVRYQLLPTLRRADGKAEVCVNYVADFVYEQDGKLVVEDVKSPPTRKLPAYVLKRKLMLFVHGITLKETT